jgi:lysophospholipid acyltransferase (LPLAT)-like uncharacterized protein
MVQITEIHLEPGGNNHLHIASMRWVSPATGEQGQSSREEIVRFLENNGQAVVTADGRTVNVEVAVDGSVKYARTRTDGIWSDNLLALPRY